jgi:hypothetical protein
MYLIIILIIIIFFILNLINKFIINREYSITKGVFHFINILKTHNINNIIIYTNEKYDKYDKYDLLNNIKLEFKNNNIKYYLVKDLDECYNYHKILNDLYDLPIVIISFKINKKIINKFSIDTLFINFDDSYNLCDNIININYGQHLIYYIRRGFYLMKKNKNTLILNIKPYLFLSELDYGLEHGFFKKKIKKEIIKSEYNNIIIPKEYFIIDYNIDKFLNLKTNYENIYLKSNNFNYFNQIINTIKLNNIFIGIDEINDYIPIKINDLTDYTKLFHSIIHQQNNYEIRIESNFSINPEIYYIFNQIKNFINIDFSKCKKNKSNNKITIFNKINTNTEIIKIHPVIFFNRLYKYIIEYFLFINLEFDILTEMKIKLVILNDDKYSKYSILNNFYFIENIKLLSINTFQYLDVFNECFNSINIMIFWDMDSFIYDIKYLNKLSKKNIIFSGYINSLDLSKENKKILEESNLNILMINNINFNTFSNIDIIINETHRSILIFYRNFF